jgi:hypothetical protein
MTPLEDKLRAALRETAYEIPADPPPPLLLSRRRRPGRRPWTAWATPLASAAVVAAVIAASLAVAIGVSRHRMAQAAVNSVPPYYVALVTNGRKYERFNGMYTAAEVRATATGRVFATLIPPQPYTTFTGVTAAVDDRTFVLSVRGANRLFILHIDPDPKTGRAETKLQAMPVAFIPPGLTVEDIALSPDGTLLAADVGTFSYTLLNVYNLVTGSERTWSYASCRECDPGGRLGFSGVDSMLSWTADGQIAFVETGLSGQPIAVRLLDTNAPGTNLQADSRVVAEWPGQAAAQPDTPGAWLGALITPDGRTVVAAEQLPGYNSHQPGGREELAKFSAATGQITAILNDLAVTDPREQVLWTDATGNVLVVTHVQAGAGAEILYGGQYTPIPWSPSIAVAAW